MQTNTKVVDVTSRESSIDRETAIRSSLHSPPQQKEVSSIFSHAHLRVEREDKKPFFLLLFFFSVCLPAVARRKPTHVKERKRKRRKKRPSSEEKRDGENEIDRDSKDRWIDRLRERERDD